jgi:hypothetical protein
MTEHTTGYAVFLHEQAIEALGEPIRPYLLDGPSGAYIGCREVDTAGAFVEMTLVDKDGGDTETELIIPSGMVRMIVSSHSQAAFGFAPRNLEPGLTALPVVGPTAPAVDAPSTATPRESGDDARHEPEG